MLGPVLPIRSAYHYPSAPALLLLLVCGFLFPPVLWP